MVEIFENPKEMFPVKGNMAIVPIEWYPMFVEDPVNAAMEYLSIPQGAVNPFFRNLEKIKEAIHKELKNPLNWETYELDSSFKAIDKRPRYMHIDLSYSETGDKTGVAMAHTAGRKGVFQRNKKGQFTQVDLPIIEFDFIGVLKPRKFLNEKEMDFDSILDLIFEISSRGFNLEEGLITFDSWESHHLKTTLFKQGFNISLLSVDQTNHKIFVDFNKPERVRRELLQRSPAAAMLSLKDAINQDRCILCNIPDYPGRDMSYFEKEAFEMQASYSGQHSLLKAVKTEGGSDDMIQACAGACFNAVNNAEFEFVSSDVDESEIEKKINSYEHKFYAQFGLQSGDEVPKEWRENNDYQNPRVRKANREEEFYNDIFGEIASL